MYLKISKHRTESICFPSLHEQSTHCSIHLHSFESFFSRQKGTACQSLFRGHVPGFPRNITHNLFLPAFLMTTGMSFQNSLALNQPVGASWYISMFNEPWCVASLRAHLARYARRVRREDDTYQSIFVDKRNSPTRLHKSRWTKLSGRRHFIISRELHCLCATLPCNKGAMMRRCIHFAKWYR